MVNHLNYLVLGLNHAACSAKSLSSWTLVPNTLPRVKFPPWSDNEADGSSVSVSSKRLSKLFYDLTPDGNVNVNANSTNLLFDWLNEES